MQLKPDDEEMTQNKKFYLDNHQDLNETEAFEPRVEAQRYIERRNEEEKLLDFIDSSFKEFFKEEEKEKLPRVTIDAIDVEKIMKATKKSKTEL